MNSAQLLAIYDEEQRIKVEYPTARREVTPHLVRHIDTLGQRSYVVYSHLDENNVDQVIREEIAYFDGLGHDFEWKLFEHDTPADLKERLAAQGFQVGEVEAILLLELDSAPAALFAPVTQDVRRLTAPDKIREALAVQGVAFGGEDDYDWLVDQLVNDVTHYPEDISIYAAYVDEIPASAAWVRFPARNRFASLWGGATLPEYRGRGLYSALVATRVQEARARGREFMTVDASPMSFPILKKFGFQLITRSYPCLWQITGRML